MAILQNVTQVAASVVRADGALGGYRWGIERKRKLLERETRRAG